jgi:hypothetical protein
LLAHGPTILRDACWLLTCQLHLMCSFAPFAAVQASSIAREKRQAAGASEHAAATDSVDGLISSVPAMRAFKSRMRVSSSTPVQLRRRTFQNFGTPPKTPSKSARPAAGCSVTRQGRGLRAWSPPRRQPRAARRGERLQSPWRFSPECAGSSVCLIGPAAAPQSPRSERRCA